jgi:[acyl-carrier-protein] S-malonyltransferase
MFSVIFPGQGSQIVGMGKDFFEKYDLVKKLFKEADETLNFSLSKLILEGPKEELNLTIFRWAFFRRILCIIMCRIFEFFRHY